MNRPRFIDFRTRVSDYVQSVGSPLAVCVGNIPALSSLVNIATERLISDPMAPEEGWWGGWAKFVFNVIPGNAFIVAPREVARIIVMDLNTCPVKVQNGFYEFLDYGPGLQPKPCKNNVCDGFIQTYDRESTFTLNSLASTPQFIQVFPVDSRDVGKTVIVQGIDQNGKTITSTDPSTNQTISGELITLANPFTNSVNQFTQITGIEKDSTFGAVTIMQVDASTQFTQPLSSMEPNETSASYRKYFVNNTPCAQPCNASTPNPQVVAQCKLEYIPVASDPDYLGIPNVPALIAECECIRYENIDNLKSQQMAATKHTKALGLLFGQLDHYLGKERPAISVSLFGPRSRLRHQPI